MTAADRIVDSARSLPWLIANVVAFTVGGALAGGALRFLEQPYYESDVSAMEAAYVQATSLGLSEAIFGAVLGTAQWLVLRRVLMVGWWVPATSLGWAIAGTIGGFLAGGSVSTIGPDDGPVPPVVAVLVGYPLFHRPERIPMADPAAHSRRGRLVARRQSGRPVGGIYRCLRRRDVDLRERRSSARADRLPLRHGIHARGVVAGILYGPVTWTVLAQLQRRTSSVDALAG